MRTTRRRIDGAAAGVLGLALTLLALCWLGATPSAGAADILGPNVAIPFPLFPTDNPWNTRVDTLPVDPNSAAYLNSMGLGTGLHADFGTVWDGAPNGIPYVCVSGTQKKVPVSFDYADESDPAPTRSPPTPPSRAARGVTAIATCSSSMSTTRCSTSSTPPTRKPTAAGRRARGRSSISAATPCGRPAGRRPTPPACPSSPAWCATTRPSPTGSSTTRCALPWPARRRPTSTRRPTTRATRPTPTCRRWACACVSSPTSTSRASHPRYR